MFCFDLETLIAMDDDKYKSDERCAGGTNKYIQIEERVNTASTVSV